MEKIGKSAIVMGIISLMVYITFNTNQPVEGEKAVKNKVIKDTLHKDIKDTIKKLK